jgi:cell division protease FtsH
MTTPIFFNDSPFIPKLIADGDALPWRRFPEAGMLIAWAADVRRALAEGVNVDAWRLIGPAIAIEDEYPRYGSDLARRLAADCGLPLCIVNTDDVGNVHDLSTAIPENEPVMIYLETGVWQEREEDSPPQSIREAREQVLAQLHAFSPEHVVIFVTVTDSLINIPPKLRAVGAFDRMFALPPITLAAAGADFIEQIGPERCTASLTDNPAKVGKVLSYDYASSQRRKQAALRMRRMYVRLGRPLEFLDLLEIHTQGLAESMPAQPYTREMQQRVACHEAGHAAMAVIDSNGRSLPEYSSIVSAADFHGVVVESVSYSFARGDRYTYEDFCHSIRISLAGRAAEELVFGPTGVTNGARSDLESCTRQTGRAFALWGFAPAMETPGVSCSNLALVVGSASPSEQTHVEELSRRFLADEYNAVLALLTANRPLLDDIASRLETEAVLDQNELAEICAKYSLHPASKKPDHSRDHISSTMAA